MVFLLYNIFLFSIESQINMNMYQKKTKWNVIKNIYSRNSTIMK